MRIINQRKDRSVNFDNVEIHIEDTRIFALGDCRILLGEYDEEQRAQEVFTEIHKTYTGVLEIEEEIEKLNKFDIDKIPKIEPGFIYPMKSEPIVILPRNTVYEMPIS